MKKIERPSSLCIDFANCDLTKDTTIDRLVRFHFASEKYDALQSHIYRLLLRTPSMLRKRLLENTEDLRDRQNITRADNEGRKINPKDFC